MRYMKLFVKNLYRNSPLMPELWLKMVAGQVAGRANNCSESGHVARLKRSGIREGCCTAPDFGPLGLHPGYEM